MRTKRLIIPPPNVIVTMIGTPNNDINRWKGNCYHVACQIVKEDVFMTDCRAVYGHYLGHISSTGYFRNCKDMPFCPHGWILLPNGDVVDPTRWVFEGKEPYIALIDHMDDAIEDYDEGGNGWRESFQQPAPSYKKDDRQLSFVMEDFDKLDGRTYVLSLLGDKRKNIKEICLDQIFWLANLSPNTLGIYVKEIYAYIEHMGYDSFIPIDNRIKILGRS